MFFISAFDRPFDKTTDGMELDTHVKATEDELEAAHAESASATIVGGNGGTIIIGGGGSGSSGASGDSGESGSSGASGAPGLSGVIISGGGSGYAGKPF